MDLKITRKLNINITLLVLIASSLLLVLTTSIFFVYSFVHTELPITSVIGFIGLVLISLPICSYEYLFNKDRKTKYIFLGLLINIVSLILSGTIMYILPGNFNVSFLVPIGMLLMAFSYMPLIYVLYRIYYEQKSRLPSIVKQLIFYINIIFILFSLFFTLSYLFNSDINIYNIIIYTAAVIGDVVILTLTSILILTNVTKIRYLFSIVFGYVVLSFMGDSLRLLSYTSFYENLNYSQGFYDVMMIFLNATLIYYILSNVKLTNIEEVMKELENTTLVIDDLITQSPDLMCICDSKGNLLKANTQFYETFNIEKLNSNITFNIFNNDIFNNDINKKLIHVKDGITIHIDDIEYMTKQNAKKYFSIKLFPTYSSDGGILNYILLSEDMTLRKNAEVALKNAYEEMETKVVERTSELSILNVALQKEIVEHEKDEERIKSSLKEKEVLLKEVHHRVKNNMQIISSLLSLQSSTLEDEKLGEILKDSQNRIKSMALIHEKLYQSDNMAYIDFNEYANSLISNITSTYSAASDRIKITTDVKNISFNVDMAIPLGLIINELVTNSYKHAFPNSMIGTISLSLTKNEYNYKLIVNDNGIGLNSQFDIENTKSIGLKLVKALVFQIDGNLHIDSNGGSCFTIDFKYDK